jgi:hypothetical protein
MKIKTKTSNSITVEFSTKEYEAFIEILKLQRKDYKVGGK